MFDIEEPKTKGLGRGLNALFEDAEIDVPSSPAAPATPAAVAMVEERLAAEPGRKRMNLGVAQLSAGPFQPRYVFEEGALEGLAASIREHGILQPILVREDPAAVGEYHIIAGERRWRAAQIAQLHEVPVIILEMSDLDAFKIALIENLQRQNLDPIEEARGYERLLNEFGQTQEDLSKSVGKSRPHISNMLRLLNLPNLVQLQLSEGKLSMGHARALVTAKDPEALAKEVIRKGLSVRQTEKFAAEAQGRAQKKHQSQSGSAAANDTAQGRATTQQVSREKDADTVALENDMTNALGMRVTIDSADGRSGKLSIEFGSLDQLDDVLHRLAHFPGSRLSG